ncbi:FGGY-family carbohydrate kinase [Parasedimentitalea maritima]|uniref:FGGY-family carbohydrate kinase n=1 Tax=Parasedimentitalea maritima TaxID=2578117 RepID=A0ABY2UUW0_9RHOB|nr:FGGY-family carbohydrate kinase [Zongyanglinia marina]TLP62765.1 FGGY-family carbohydrate kinase [Zongyanglinia marina]
MMHPIFIGIDVGTGSARAGAFDQNGRLIASFAVEIETFYPQPDFVEQSSTNIWEAICKATHAVLSNADITAEQVKGIGFDATCSLVALDQDFQPISISPSGDNKRNIVVWMDHRALSQTARINAQKHPILQFTGNVISPEMQIPKLLWLKENLPSLFEKTAHFFDLPDWLVHRATGTQTRSLCSATCKWTYQGKNGYSGEGWDREFLNSVGLEPLLQDNTARIGNHFAAPGAAIDTGLTDDAANELGLIAGTPVAASLIDAYAGALGTMGVEAKTPKASSARVALISGTSACHITTTSEPLFVPGVWGPYFSVLGPDQWANEAGQSMAGALIDRVLDGHSATSSLRLQADEQKISLYDQLEQVLAEQAGCDADTHTLTRHIHIQPDFHGNRAPLADPLRKGAITGLTKDCGVTDLALQYLAALQALAYGTRQIIEAMNEKGAGIDTIVVSGGLALNALYLREHADATGLRILQTTTQEPVLLGSAMLAATAAGQFDTLQDAMREMCGPARTIAPRRGKPRAFHDAKYAVFLKMQTDFAAYRDLMTSPGDI